MTRPLLVTLALITLVGCGVPNRHETLREALRTFDDKGDPHLKARREALKAEIDAQPPISVIRRADFRVENIELTNTDPNAKPRFEFRLPFQNPWRLNAERTLHTAQAEASLAELQGDALMVEVRKCIQSTRFEAHALHAEAWRAQREDLDAIGAWLLTLRESQHLSEARLQSRLLAHKSRLLRTDPGPTPLKPEVLDPRPLALSVPEAPLDTDPQTLEDLLLAHPLWAGYEADEARLIALAGEQSARRLPWFQWLSLSFEPSTIDRDERIEALFSITLPLGIEERAEARVYEARAKSVRWKAKALFEAHRLRLQAALEGLKQHEARTKGLIELAAEADKQRGATRRWIEQRSATPQEAEASVEDVFEIKRALIEAREAAALLRCEALALTGRRIGAWPRQKIGP